jgi:hypothetical protein
LTSVSLKKGLVLDLFILFLQIEVAYLMTLGFILCYSFDLVSHLAFWCHPVFMWSRSPLLFLSVVNEYQELSKQNFGGSTICPLCVVFKLAHNSLQIQEVAGIFTTILDLKLNFN